MLHQHPPDPRPVHTRTRRPSLFDQHIRRQVIIIEGGATSEPELPPSSPLPSTQVLSAGNSEEVNNNATPPVSPAEGSEHFALVKPEPQRPNMNIPKMEDDAPENILMILATHHLRKPPGMQIQPSTISHNAYTSPFRPTSDWMKKEESREYDEEVYRYDNEEDEDYWYDEDPRSLEGQLKGSFECIDCHKVFTYHSHMLRHRRVHSGEKPYNCHLCGKLFSESSNLKTHMKRIHGNNRDYVCGHCGKAFAVNGDLTKHVRVHTKEKPFACILCGRRFSDRSNLTQHSRIHTGQKLHECVICRRRYSRKSSLRRHQRKSHPGQIISSDDETCSEEGYVFPRGYVYTSM